MTFECRQCGSCCMHLGDYIVIGQQTGPFEFEGCCVSTGMIFPARIDEDKRDLFMDRSWIDLHPSACPFLRPRGERIVCTIHETSPSQCKAFRCVILQVLSADGSVIGKVTGTLALHSSDPGLRDAWGGMERLIARHPEDAEARIQPYLEEKGYRCA